MVMFEGGRGMHSPGRLLLSAFAFHRVQEHPKQSSDEEIMTI